MLVVKRLKPEERVNLAVGMSDVWGGVKFNPQTQTYAITADVTKPANSIIITNF